uniref:Pancreatic trypsin inhibitor n=1 Tax=Rhipicephalus appendiculatus TaxID=34631 RepID=A0A131YU58_RHIAP
MDKTAFVLLLIFSNIVPLLAWGSTAQVWNRRKSAPVQAHVQRQRRSARSSDLYSYNTTKKSCQIGSCVYPPMCHCPITSEDAYMRFPEDTEETGSWYYNNATNKCEQNKSGLNVCNNFRDQQHCEARCKGAEKWTLKLTRSQGSGRRA